jgi:hypothetical protein
MIHRVKKAGGKAMLKIIKGQAAGSKQIGLLPKLNSVFAYGLYHYRGDRRYAALARETIDMP